MAGNVTFLEVNSLGAAVAATAQYVYEASNKTMTTGSRLRGLVMRCSEL